MKKLFFFKFFCFLATGICIFHLIEAIQPQTLDLVDIVKLIGLATISFIFAIKSIADNEQVSEQHLSSFQTNKSRKDSSYLM